MFSCIFTVFLLQLVNPSLSQRIMTFDPTSNEADDINVDAINEVLLGLKLKSNFFHPKNYLKF